LTCLKLKSCPRVWYVPPRHLPSDQPRGREQPRAPQSRRGAAGREGRRPPDLPPAGRDGPAHHRQGDVMSVAPAPQELRARALAWSQDDPDPLTRSALSSLVEQADAGSETAAAELADAFAGHLEFGTAGLRGRMGAGPNRMNLAVVSRAARGLADYLLNTLSLAE